MKKKNKKEFSKVLLVQESILVWIVAIAVIALAAYSILTGFEASEFTWLTTLVGALFAAYGVSQAAYYKKAKDENLLKIQKLLDEENSEEEEDEVEENLEEENNETEDL